MNKTKTILVSFAGRKMKKLIPILFIGIMFSSLFVTTGIASPGVPISTFNNGNTLSLHCDCASTDLGQASASTSLRFTATYTGTYTIYCSVSKTVTGYTAYFNVGNGPSSITVSSAGASFSIGVSAAHDPEPGLDLYVTVKVTITSGSHSASASKTIHLSEDGSTSSSGTSNTITTTGPNLEQRPTLYDGDNLAGI